MTTRRARSGSLVSASFALAGLLASGAAFAAGEAPPRRFPGARPGAGRVVPARPPRVALHPADQAAVDTLPRLRSSALADLETLGPAQTALLDETPSADELRGALGYRNGEHELRFTRLPSDRWLVTAGFRGSVGWMRDAAYSLEQRNLFAVDVHTHPQGRAVGTQAILMIPSFQDADSAATLTADRTAHIVTEGGVLRLRAPATLPGGQPTARTAYSHWIHGELRLSEREYLRRGEVNLLREFFQRSYGLTVIPWSDRAAIDGALGTR